MGSANSFQSNDLCVWLNMFSKKGADSPSHLVLAATRKKEKIAIAILCSLGSTMCARKSKLLLRVIFFFIVYFFFKIRNPSSKILCVNLYWLSPLCVNQSVTPIRLL